MTTPRERPILMSAPMVRAIIAGDKTMTRRIVKPKRGSFPPADHPAFKHSIGYSYAPARYTGSAWTPGAFMLTGAVGIARDEGAPHEIQCPYGAPGDRLWVRESLARGFLPNLLTGEPTSAEIAQYGSDAGHVVDAIGFNLAPWWSGSGGLPSIHMPRWASRLTLEVTGVRVERVQAISDADIAAEGVTVAAVRDLWRAATGPDRREMLGGPRLPDGTKPDDDGAFIEQFSRSPRVLWAYGWTLINGAESWRSNPWCWVISFRRLP